MDEQELRSLFSAAPGDAPASTFSQDDVVRESRRQTVRLRNRITAGVSAAALVVVGFGAYGVLSGGTPESLTSADNGAMSSQSGPGSGQPGLSPARPEVGGESPNFPAQPPQQGGDGDGKTGHLAEGASGCEQVDGELAIALAGELSVAPDQASPAGLACPSGSRSASFDVEGGRVFAVVVPGRQALGTPPDAAKTSEITDDDATLYVVSESPAFAGKVDGIAANLRGRF